MKQTAYDIAKAALMEVGRQDLAKFLYSSSDNPTVVHYEPLCVLMDGGYDLFRNDMSLPNLEELALIEKAMRIAYASFEKPYECASCEANFESHGISHRRDLLHHFC